MIKRSLLFIAALYYIFGCSSVFAVTIEDHYFGGDPRVQEVGFDIFGSAKYYDVTKAEVSLAGSTLTVDIYSRYFDNIGQGNTELGDLFLSTDGWHPYGTAPYGKDRYSLAGEEWEFAVVMDDHSGAGNNHSGTAGLYRVKKSNILLPDDVMGIYPHRQDQEVQYDISSQNSIVDGQWQIFNPGGVDTDDYLRYTIDISSISGLDINNLGIRWTMTCANDIIEGAAVPEPATLILFGAGIMGLSGSLLRRKKM